MHTSIRNDIINAYDDEHAVNSACHSLLDSLCNLYGWKDIQEKVDLISTKSGYRYYLGENDAEELRKVVLVDAENFTVTPVKEKPVDNSAAV